MAKLNQLIMLENMMKTYDAMNIKDANLTHFQGVCTEKLVDEINGRLERLVVSEVRMSCRNVLLANFETMTKTENWLGCRLFSDLPRAESRVLREKVEQMVELLNELVLKIVNVDEEYAKSFFERIKRAYRKRRITKFELWKAQQSQITIERLVTYQVDLTADMLLSGILKDAETPNGEDVQNVDKDKLALKLTDKSIITDDFIRECAKLRRYSHWEGDRFIIDYHLLRKYLFRVFGKLTCEQHVKMYEYDIQMKQIHEEIERLEKEKGVLGDDIDNEDLTERLKPIFYNNEDDVEIFLKEIKGMSPNDITDLVNRWVKEKRISNYGNSRKGDLWTMLNDAGLYTKSRQNWNRRVY